MESVQGSDDDFTDGRFVFHPVTYSFIYRQLTKLKVNKATRLDQIPSAYFETRTGLGLGLGLGPEENPDSGKTRTRARTRV